MPPLALLRQLFDCDPDAGKLTWKLTKGSAVKGAEVGTVNNVGYLSTSVKGSRFLLHRLIWVLAGNNDPGQLQIDHINGDRLDNRIANLRLAQRIENNKNVKTHQDNSTGHLGISEHKPGIYRVRIMKDGKNHHIGLFSSLTEAVAARRNAELDLHGEFSSYASRSSAP
jgi:hypothetical protein